MTTQKHVLDPKKPCFFRHHATFFLTTRAVFLWFLGVYNMVELHGLFLFFMDFLKNSKIPCFMVVRIWLYRLAPTISMERNDF